MSWILNPEGDKAQAKAGALQNARPKPAAAAAAKDDEPQVPDPSDPTRLVSGKAANRPFLVHQQYRANMAKAHAEWEARQKERAEKLARGEAVGPEEPDPTAEPEVGCLGLLKFVLYTLIFIVLAGKFLTGSYLWEMEVPDIRQWIPTDQKLFSEQALLSYDGSVEGRPVYLAIDGDVYDVTAGKATYGPGGSYHMMAGKDAARAYATGCFAQHQTYDIRGLDENELRGLNHWKKFYAESKKYPKVGRVSHPPIDPMSPIPVHCDAKKAKKQSEGQKAVKKAAAAAAAKREEDAHSEL